MQIHNNTLITECSAYDFKEMLERKKVKSWLKSVSAFANTDGGSLFYGVNDDGVIVGLENPQADADFISEMIKARLDPVPEVQLIPIEHEGHTLLEVKVKTGTLTPYYYYQDGTRTAYMRIGNESVEFPFGGKALFLLTLCLFLSAGAAAQRRAARIKADSIAATYAGRVQGGAHLHFYETTHDFGDIPRKGGNLVREFEFVNDGTEPLVLLRVLTSCTCTKASFSKRPVAPGERGVVKVIYEPHKKEPGAFSKVIQIFSTSIEGRNVLTVRGNSIDVKKL